ncbi:MAG: hypothetical protein AAF849_20090, partial [Bacteroidota bacterium]
GLGQASALISTLFWLIQYFVFNAFLALFSLKEIRSILIIPQKNSENRFFETPLSETIFRLGKF